MRHVLRLLLSLVRDRRGATAVEYAFLLALVVLAIMVALVELGSTTSRIWGDVSNKVEAAH